LLLSFRDAHVYSRNLQLQQPEAECEKWFQQPMDELAAAHLKYVLRLSVNIWHGLLLTGDDYVH